MSLSEMTIQKAFDIVDIVTPLMINRGVEDRFYFGYSQLKGYDIFDVANALKLFNAFYYFKKGSEEKELDKLIINSNRDNGLLINLCFLLVPDQIIIELSKYEYMSSEYIVKVCELVDHTEYDKFISSGTETVESFLKYCIQLDRNNPEYWLKVYYRLGLVYNPDDEIIKLTNLNFE